MAVLAVYQVVLCAFVLFCAVLCCFEQNRRLNFQTTLYFSIALLGIFQRLNKIQPSRAAAYIGINPHTFPVPV